MKHLNYNLTGFFFVLLIILGCAGMTSPTPQPIHHSSLLTTASMSDFTSFAAMPRWWDDMVQWIRSLGWDRSRLVQMWLFFMLIGLYIILRIKPRA